MVEDFSVNSETKWEDIITQIKFHLQFYSINIQTEIRIFLLSIKTECAKKLIAYSTAHRQLFHFTLDS